MKYLFILLSTSFIISQETLSYDLPTNRFPINPQIEEYQLKSELSGYTSVNQLIISPNNVVWKNDQYHLYLFKLIL